MSPARRALIQALRADSVAVWEVSLSEAQYAQKARAALREMAARLELRAFSEEDPSHER